MTDKRPWTEHVTWDKCPCGCDLYRLSNHRFGGFSEPDARLFAAAPALYEALDAQVQWEADLILSESINALSTPLMEKLLEVQRVRNAALRAANPDAFESEDE